MNYSDHVVNNLVSNDIKFLNALFSQDATSKFSSLPKSQLEKATEFKQFTFQKVSHKLKTLMFVDCVRIKNTYFYFLTQFGMDAIYKIIERDEVECVTE